MAITKDKKIEIVKKVMDLAQSDRSLVFVNFHGLTVAAVNELRRKLQVKGLGYYVAKKTLIKRALEDRKIDGALPELAGEIGIAFATAEAESDPLLPVKEVYEFHQKNKDTTQIVGGVFENAYAPAEAMLALAKIPSRLVLYAQFLNVINSPIQGLVIGLDAIAQKRETVAS